MTHTSYTHTHSFTHYRSAQQIHSVSLTPWPTGSVSQCCCLACCCWHHTLSRKCAPKAPGQAKLLSAAYNFPQYFAKAVFYYGCIAFINFNEILPGQAGLDYRVGYTRQTSRPTIHTTVTSRLHYYKRLTGYTTHFLVYTLYGYLLHSIICPLSYCFCFSRVCFCFREFVASLFLFSIACYAVCQ